MVTDGRRGTLLRPRDGHGGRVTTFELFLDLVYVFAITQLSHLLAHHLTAHGAAQAAMLLLPVWWAWMYTAWATNWLDPDKPAVRLMLIAVMLLSLLMSASLPEAFGERGLMFAAAYAAIQVGRTAFVLAAVRADPTLRRNFQRILAWNAAAGALWLVGGLVEGSAREAWWLAALAVDFVAPAAGYAVPGLGRSTTREWTIAGHHLAERCQLFVILSLGESILVTGATFGDLAWTPDVVAAFALAFLGSVGLWWVYFSRAAEDSAHSIEASADPGRLGRSAYTYLHVPIVAGVIVAAVGDGIAISDPSAAVGAAGAAVILAGPALFLTGHALFTRAVFGRFPPVHLLAAAVLVALVPFAAGISGLAATTVSTLAVAGVATWDWWSGRHGVADRSALDGVANPSAGSD